MTTITPDDSANAQLVANGSATHNDTDGTAAPSMPPLMIAESVASTRLGNVAATAPAIDNAPLLPDALAMDADFDDGLGQRIEWMAREGIGQARLKLTPEGMGQISIQLNLDGNRLDAQFQASHSQVRHALNASLDHLREMLREQGMQLGNTHVGQQAQGGASGEREPAQATQAAASGNDPADDGVADAQSPAPRWQGSTSHLLDTWA
ncbi:MAG: flagellar hook-length control protein FliK [Pseudomonadota bacterium]|nr:flagellar hook-length control protein FliK [Pseudomonadota bacterium]